MNVAPQRLQQARGSAQAFGPNKIIPFTVTTQFARTAGTKPERHPVHTPKPESASLLPLSRSPPLRMIWASVVRPPPAVAVTVSAPVH